MADVSSNFVEKLGGVATKWSAFAALGSFLLYLLGYLTLRFQLSTYGVATNLDLLGPAFRRRQAFVLLQRTCGRRASDRRHLLLCIAPWKCYDLHGQAALGCTWFSGCGGIPALAGQLRRADLHAATSP